MSSNSGAIAAESPFFFEAKIPPEILHQILSHNLPPIDNQSHFASLARVNKRWSAQVSKLLLSAISIPERLDLQNGENLLQLLGSYPEKRSLVKCIEADGSDLACKLLMMLSNIQTLTLDTKVEGTLTYAIPPLPNLRTLGVKLFEAQPDNFFPTLQDCHELRNLTLGSLSNWTRTLSEVKLEKLESLNLQLWSYHKAIFDAFVPSASTLRKVTILRVRKQNFDLIDNFLMKCYNLEVFNLQADFQRRNISLCLPPRLKALDVASVLFEEDQGVLELGLDAGYFFSNLANNSHLQELQISGIAIKDSKLYGRLPNLETCIIHERIFRDDELLLFSLPAELQNLSMGARFAEEVVEKSHLACLEPCFFQENFKFLMVPSSLIDDLSIINDLVKNLTNRRPPISLGVEFGGRPVRNCSELLSALMQFPILHLSGIGRKTLEKETLYALEKIIGHQSKNVILFSSDLLLFNYVQSGLECPFEVLKAMLIPVDFGTKVAQNQAQFCQRKGVDFLRAPFSQSVVNLLCRRLGIWD
ncbi:hypothetical protein BT69DRAFT_1316722 [Atractiella rhizophila]|nr:hypothetical protein BT69DRAFT_1316722 [Atractiella rhizophila]